MDLETTVGQLAPRLLRYCVAVTGAWSLAEDVAQDALVALVTRWRYSGPPESAEAFVFAIARRRAARLRRRQRWLAPLGAVGVVASGERSPEARTSGSEELARVLRGMASMPGKEAEALALVVLGELSSGEAAALLGIGESALKMRVARARARLRKALHNGHRP